MILHISFESTGVDMDRTATLARLTEHIARHSDGPGRSATSIPGVNVFRADEPSPIRCMIYHPCVIIVAQGHKRARVADVDFDYSPAHYLVLPVSLPIDAQVLEASRDRPFLSFAIDVDASQLGEIASELDPAAPEPEAPPRGIAVSETTDALLDASVRLLACLDAPSDCRVLAPQIKREILYRVLRGPQGRLLRGVGSRDSRLGQVARSLALIHAEFDRPMEVAELARAAHMSDSTFYEAFKAITSFSPLQYLKEIRLNRARQLLLWEGASAKHAAGQVGYRSLSQFSREFKRRFGRPPREERTWAVATGEVSGPRPY